MTSLGRDPIALAHRRLVCCSLAATALLTLASCGGNGPVTAGPGWRGDQFAHEVASRPDQYVGRRLSITGPVHEVFNKDVFSLGAEGEILVVNPYEQPVLPETKAGEQVTVNGDLRRLSGDALEPALRQKLDAAGSVAGSYEGKPVLIARSLRVLEK